MAIANARNIKRRVSTFITPLGNAFSISITDDTLLPQRSRSLYVAPQSSEDMEAVQFRDFLERIAIHARVAPHNSANVLLVMKGVPGGLLDSILKYGWQPLVDLVSPATAPASESGPIPQDGKATGR
jgi:hypothetical protein